MKQQIVKMKNVIAGLKSQENDAVRSLIQKFDEGDKRYTVNMGIKARRIEKSMAAVPIEDRAKLLESTDSKVTDVLKAIAWHRKSWGIFSNEEGPIKEGPIKVDSSANAFKDFTNNFKDAINKRKDVEVKRDKSVSPKIK